jgi:hypothetical protein
VVVADSSKWGVIGISSIARFDEADTLVTDSGLSAEARSLAGDQVRELLIAPVEAAPGGAGEALIDNTGSNAPAPAAAVREPVLEVRR